MNAPLAHAKLLLLRHIAWGHLTPPALVAACGDRIPKETLYTTLHRLKRAGLIRIAGTTRLNPRGPRSKIYELTDQGLDALEYAQSWSRVRCYFGLSNPDDSPLEPSAVEETP